MNDPIRAALPDVVTKRLVRSVSFRSIGCRSARVRSAHRRPGEPSVKTRGEEADHTYVHDPRLYLVALGLWAVVQGASFVSVIVAARRIRPRNPTQVEVYVVDDCALPPEVAAPLAHYSLAPLRFRFLGCAATSISVEASAQTGRRPRVYAAEWVDTVDGATVGRVSYLHGKHAQSVGSFTTRVRRGEDVAVVCTTTLDGGLSGGRPPWAFNQVVPEASLDQLLAKHRTAVARVPLGARVPVPDVATLRALERADNVRLQEWRFRTGRLHLRADGTLQFGWGQCLWWAWRTSSVTKPLRRWCVAHKPVARPRYLNEPG